MKPWAVRDERPGDEPAIAVLIGAAFRDAPHSDGSEAAIVARLRAAGELALSLVLVDRDEAIIGHVAFSPVSISDGTEAWYGLGPVAVIPLHQRGGIGATLIAEGLARLRSTGARGCVVLGEPAYYARFGFAHDPRLAYTGPQAEYFQRVVFAGDSPTGKVSYAAPFSVSRSA